MIISILENPCIFWSVFMYIILYSDFVSKIIYVNLCFFQILKLFWESLLSIDLSIFIDAVSTNQNKHFRKKFSKKNFEYKTTWRIVSTKNLTHYQLEYNAILTIHHILYWVEDFNC